MEILILVLLYYLSQNPAFAESVKPLMSKIKDSEQMLNFLNDLSKFSGAFGGFGGSGNASGTPNPHQAGKASAPHQAGETTQQSSNHRDKAEKDSWQADGAEKVWADGENNSAAQEDKKNLQSPTQGIADEFIQNILDSYLKKR